jgi:hypothetical protein
MKKGDVVICVDAKSSDYITTGKKYEVMSGDEDDGSWCFPQDKVIGFEIK